MWYRLALVAHVVLQAVSLEARVAGVAERAAGVLDEPGVRQLRAALLAPEARRVPVRIHRLYHAPDHKLTYTYNLI